MATVTPTPDLSVASFRGNAARMRKEAVIKNVFRAAAALSIVISALIVLSLVREAWTFISPGRVGEARDHGLVPPPGAVRRADPRGGSVLVTLVAMLVAIPIGMGAAVYLSEYATVRVRRVLKPPSRSSPGSRASCSGTSPSRSSHRRSSARVVPSSNQFNLAAAGIGVGILTIPLIASIAEDAMRSVPGALREASYGMGARKVTTSVRS
jgi:phosphate transport system permease protein